MNLLTHQELLAYPANTIYLYVANPLCPPRHGYNLLCQKGETTGQGFLYRFLVPTCCNGLPTGYGLDPIWHPSGDGGYNSGRRQFLVFEREEVQSLIYAVSRAGGALAWSPSDQRESTATPPS